MKRKEEKENESEENWRKKKRRGEMREEKDIKKQKIDWNLFLFNFHFLNLCKVEMIVMLNKIFKQIQK